MKEKAYILLLFILVIGNLFLYYVLYTSPFNIWAIYDGVGLVYMVQWVIILYLFIITFIFLKKYFDKKTNNQNIIRLFFFGLFPLFMVIVSVFPLHHKRDIIEIMQKYKTGKSTK
jgi:membrane protease YdiL (CAAX protease family)